MHDTRALNTSRLQMCDNMRTHNRSARKYVIIGIIATALFSVAGVYVLPRIFRESKVEFDRHIDLGPDRVRVTMICARDRTIISIPHGPQLGGGHPRYQTKIAYPSGLTTTFETDLEPQSLWTAKGRLFVECCGPGFSPWFTGEIIDGQVIPVDRTLLPEPPPNWRFADL